MENLKIGIVEDDLIIAESITVMLQQIGYRTVPAVRDYAGALKMLDDEFPDLLLIDIRLDSQLDGIDLAKKMRVDYGIPFIFITANSDPATVDRAKQVRPYAYLVKPFDERDLFSAIEIAFSAFNHESKAGKASDQTVTYLKEFIFIKENHLFHKVAISDIWYIESENVYLTIYTAARNFVVRLKLEDFINTYTQGGFYRVHRSYAINIKHLETINTLTVRIAGKEIPTHKAYRQELLRVIQSI